jgi:DUF2075 family protein
LDGGRSGGSPRRRTDPSGYCSGSYSLRGIKTLAEADPEAPDALTDELIKNTYRTLMTRGLQWCYLSVCDPQLEAYLRRRIARMQVTQ